MSQVELGKTPQSKHRDAIHLAVIPVLAGESLLPGQQVGIDNNTAVLNASAVGIVDPFLTKPVMKGDSFWLCLFPNTVTGMWHEWQHPMFAGFETQSSVMCSKEESEQWLRVCAAEMNCYDTPDEAFKRLIDGLKSKDLYAYGSDLHGLYELEEADDLKMHAENYLGIQINWDEYGFTCSC